MSDPFFDFFNSDRPNIDAKSPQWKEISFKEYPRSPRILLPKPKLPEDLSLAEILRKRRSERNFSNKPLSKEVIGTLLYWSAGLINKDRPKEYDFPLRRSYPSGGARFPVEIYIAIFRGEDIDSGAYHYNFLKHALEKIENSSAENICQDMPYDFSKEMAAALILLSFSGKRTIEKYGSLGYKLGLLEGGHIGQNIYLVGTALNLGILALGGMKNYNHLEKELNLYDDESLFYQLAIGWPKN